jgi:ATP-dependent Clp protease ATP-binding subunit ClpA
VFERFTERARLVVVRAQEEALGLRHNYIGTEHLLIGLLRVEEGCAARVLDSLDVTLEEARAQVRRLVGQGDEPATGGEIPFTPRAKKVLEFSRREALSLGHNYIATEHILLGLVRETDGVAARILLDFDVGAETIRNQIIRMLSGPTADPVELSRLRDERLAAVQSGELTWAEELEDRERVRAWLTGSDEPSQIAVDLGGQPASSARAPLALGWALSAVAFGLGLLAGWLIWG